jgi:hypothetical protein
MAAPVDATVPDSLDHPNAYLARPSFGVNHVLAYGQSLSSGWEG